MQSDYAQQYEDLWRRHWWWQSRKQFVLAQLRRLRRDRPFPAILDVGCGNGLFFDDLAAFGQVWGIEPDAGLVAADGPYRARIAVRGFDSSFLPPPEASGGFDLVLMLDVLEHIEDDLAAARHVHTILAPGGRFLLTVPALRMLWSAHDEANRHFRRYSKASLRHVLTAAGFRVQMLRCFFGWTIGPLLLRRAISPGKKDPAAYHVAVPMNPVNQAMYALSRLEQSTLGRWGLPLGSSLIAVAVKAP